jgi:LacI family transcriptional regulator
MRKIGVRQIARLANVSIGTVDRALNGRNGISESTRKHILAIAERIGYRPDPAARALSVGRVPIRLGLCIPEESHYYFDNMRHGIFAEARRLERLGVQLVYRPFTTYGVEQVAVVSDLLNSDIQGLIVAPGEPAQLTSLIDEAEERNIRVVCVDSDARDSHRSTVVCVDTEVVGKVAAELMSGFVAPKSEVAVIGGLCGVEAHQKKIESFCALYCLLNGWDKAVRVVEACGEEEETFQKCFTLLGECKSLAGLYVNTATNCLPACRAICAHGLCGKIMLITTDLFRSMVPYFERGTIRVSIHQRPFTQGAIAVRLLVDHLVNGGPLPPSYYLAPHIVMRSNLYAFREIRHTIYQADQILPHDHQTPGPHPFSGRAPM